MIEHRYTSHRSLSVHKKNAVLASFVPSKAFNDHDEFLKRIDCFFLFKKPEKYIKFVNKIIVQA